MSKILFAWELGEGNGHILPHLELISRLVEQGHEVHFALRSMHKAYDIFHDSGVIWHQAPLVLPRHVEIMFPIDSYAKILHHAGYDNAKRLSGLIVAWQNLYKLIDPDLIIFDYSPTGMLAARAHRAKTIVTGTGFELPPKARPIKSIATELGETKDQEEVLGFENKVFEIINEALKLSGMDVLDQFTDMLNADEVVLRTLKELDHYTERDDTTYAGISKSPGGELPVWPEMEGPKIFAYLKPFETLSGLLGALNKKRYPTLIYGDKIPEESMRSFSSPSLRFVAKPLDMTVVGEGADVAITNAGHGSSAELLLSGVPMLLLPLNSEQKMVANNVERIGAGLSAPNLHPAGMPHKLEQLITEKKFKEAAMSFADSYRDRDVTKLPDALLKTINSLL